MIPSVFEYHKATSIADAIAKLRDNEDAKLLAGGHSLLPMMKLRFAETPYLVDINGIEELKGIRIDGDTITIGAMTTESELINSDILQQYCPLLVDAAKLVADPQVRNKGTIGGDVAHGDPGNDHPAVMLALDAQLVIHGPNGERTIPANGFFLGTYWTALEEHEILVAIKVPALKPGTGHGYSKLKRKTGDYAVAGAPVVVEMDGDIVRDIRIGLTNVAPMAIRAEAAEDLIRGKRVDEALLKVVEKAVIAVCDPAVDLRGDEEYKSHMAAIMARRSIIQAIANAKG
ncbi:MAG: carbon-monoxide dehydrogenase medium subunit [Paraglaciecola sp.]|jgi:carbon-monoxide dehydrogenase medium subunit